MLTPIIDHLCRNRVVLASQSPRRKELLNYMGFKDIEIVPSRFEENLKPEDFSDFPGYVEETALQKVLEVDARLKNENGGPVALICGADTIVTLNGTVYGKPKTKRDAFRILSELSGKTHTVYTGVVLKMADRVHKFTQCTRVTMSDLTSDRINEYIATGDPMDKAGGYGIQGYGCTVIERIEGDVYTVIGLPVPRLAKFLMENVTLSER